jgi:hypothetical protein
MNPERNYVLSLLRREGEDASTTLQRVYDFWIDPTEVQHGTLRRLLIFIQDNSARSMATSTKIAADYLGVDWAWLAGEAESVDHQATRLYSELMTEELAQNHFKEIGQMLQKDGISSEQMLDELQAEIAQIRLTKEKERILTAWENQKDFLKWVHQQQEFIKSGQQRVAFPIAFPRLDEMIPYLFPGNVVLLTSQTKVGKSTFVQQWMDDQAKRGFRCVFCHFEDTPVLMGLKRIVRESTV